MRKYAIGLATAVLFGVGVFQQASAGEVLIPYIKSGGNWVSLVSYTAYCPDYNGGAAACDGSLHFIYWYKKDWDGFSKIADSNNSAADGSYDDAACKEYNVEVPATPADFTTVDVSMSNKLGLTNNVLGKAEGYDGAVVNGAPTAPTNTDFVLEPDAVVDAYLIIDDSNSPTTQNRDPNTLAAEAVVFDMVTGMFFYQFGIDMRGSVDVNEDGTISTQINDNRLAPGLQTLMFQGEDFATTSVYYIPVTNSQDAVNQIIQGNNYSCLYPSPSSKTVVDRQEDEKSGLGNICVKCLGLIPVKYFMSDSLWNKIGKSGGAILFADGYTANNINYGGGVTYKGEVFKIGTKPNIFAPLKSYENSLSRD